MSEALYLMVVFAIWLEGPGPDKPSHGHHCSGGIDLGRFNGTVAYSGFGFSSAYP
jgi:hypothetical protein